MTSESNEPGEQWPTGRSEVEAYIARGFVSVVDADPDSAHQAVEHAKRHLRSAELIAADDPYGAVSMAYSAARKSLWAVLIAQGLNPSGDDSHKVTGEVVSVQLGQAGSVIRPFQRMRNERREAEYYNRPTAYDESDARRCVGDAAAIVEAMEKFLAHVHGREFA